MKSAAHSADAVRFTTHHSRLTDAPIDSVDRRIILATQAGLPLTHQPYHWIATELALEPAEVMERIRRMLVNGVIRRIGAVPNHYALGYRANAMSVWDVPDARVRRLGPRIGELDFVSHCYRRPRHLPHWPYNLFAMVHGHNRAEVEAKAARIAELLGRDNRGHALLYSTRILKKTGLRIGEG
jgi:DNA-binding Lrp family transcriptional regulator